VLVPAAVAPKLGVSPPLNGKITITWTPAVGTLLASPAIVGPNVNWESVTNGTGTARSITVPLTGGPMFFKVLANP
jgi:hypothetical protein